MLDTVPQGSLPYNNTSEIVRIIITILCLRKQRYRAVKLLASGHTVKPEWKHGPAPREVWFAQGSWSGLLQGAVLSLTCLHSPQRSPGGQTAHLPEEEGSKEWALAGNQPRPGSRPGLGFVDYVTLEQRPHL